MRYRKFCSPSDECSEWSSDSDVCSGKCCICGSGYRSDSDWYDTRCEDCNEGKSEGFRKRFRPSCERVHRAIETHDCRAIRDFLEDGFKPCTTNPTSCFILAYKTTFILKKFLEIEPSGVNCQDSRGYTMLMLSENDEIFRLLCKYNPDLNIQNEDGDTIFFHLLKSRRQFHSWQLEKLLELGLDVNSVSSKGETAMELAIREGVNYYTIEKLLKAGATPPPAYKDGESIVTLPIQKYRLNLRGKIDFLESLMKNGIDVSAKDIDGRNVMYYIILEHFKVLSNMYEKIDTYLINLLERLLIMLLEKNCEVQGMCLTFERGNVRMGPDYSYHEKLDIIGTFARHLQSIKFLEQLVNRGLYNWTSNIKMYRELFPGTTDPMSPLTAYLSRLYTHCWKEPDFQQILKTCKYFISIGVDPTHRSRNQNCHIDLDNYYVFCTHFSDIANELTYPDALYFMVQMKAIHASGYDMSEESVMHLEELLRLLLRFWPYPPLFLILLRVGLEVWDHRCRPRSIMTFSAYEDMTLLTRLLIKIGGAVPLGTHYYENIKILFQEVAHDNRCKWTQIMDSFLKLDGGIPSLRSLGHAAFRATVKKTCPTGLDFSEYRVLCQGEMVPLPPKVVNFLEFRT